IVTSCWTLTWCCVGSSTARASTALAPTAGAPGGRTPRCICGGSHDDALDGLTRRGPAAARPLGPGDADRVRRLAGRTPGRRSAARRGRAPTRRVLRRTTPGVRPAARGRRHRVPAEGLVLPAHGPLRRDGQLRADRRGPGVRAGDRTGGRRGERRQPAADRRPLPPGGRERRRPHRLRRGCGAQADPARPGTTGAVLSRPYGPGVGGMRHSVAMTDECVYRRITADAAEWEFFEPTRFAIGPWDDRLQHGGPVSALLARAMDRVETPTDGRLARLTFEILRPVLMGPVGVRARLVRPGRKVSLVEAEMIQTDADGEQATVALARAWRIARSDTAAARHVPLEPLAPVMEAELDDPDMKVPALLDRGFVGGLEWVVRSPIGRRGAPTAAWARPRFGLVEGERGTALERFVMVADSANG